MNCNIDAEYTGTLKYISSSEIKIKFHPAKSHLFNLLNNARNNNNTALKSRGRHSCDRMVVGFTTTNAISAYHH